MSDWIEIPEHRILEVSRFQAKFEFTQVNSEGEKTQQGEMIYRMIRNKDSKVFKPAEFIPVDHFEKDSFYLQEL